MNVVIDTNVLLRMAAGGKHFPLYVMWRERRFMLVMSEPLFDEFLAVADRPKTQRFLPLAYAREFAEIMRTMALWLPLAANFPHCRDPKDDIVVATAVAARPCYLLTTDGDLCDDANLVKLLWELKIQVVQPSEFLSKLSKTRG